MLIYPVYNKRLILGPEKSVSQSALEGLMTITAL